jgi:hypothetical protein
MQRIKVLRVSQKVPPTTCETQLIKQRGWTQVQWNVIKNNRDNTESH